MASEFLLEISFIIWDKEFSCEKRFIQAENTHSRGKYHCMPDILFDWFGFDRTSKTVLYWTQAKQLNPKK